LAVRVLVAEDDPILRSLVAGQIGALGYEVTAAENGLVAAEIAERDPPDVLVTDWSMPGLDGVDLIRRLRTNGEADRHLHIILMTASAAEDAIREGLAAGADDFLPKPIDMLKLELGLTSARRVVLLQRRLQQRNKRLAEAHEELRGAYRTLQRDLEAAANTQQWLLPKPGRLNGVAFDWLFLPSNLVGGDLFDIVPLSKGRTFVFHIDVAGHGVPAALRSAFLHDRLTRGAMSGDLARTAVEVNNILLQDVADDGYCTALLALIDAEAGKLSLLRAGHPPPMLQRADGTKVWLQEGGLPLGLLATEAPPVTEMDFGPGDRLFLYSDGLIDCADSCGDPFGEERFEGLVRNTTGMELPQTIARVRRSLTAYATAGFSDDVSLLVIDSIGATDHDEAKGAAN